MTETKRPDYSHRPKAALLWALLVPFVVAELIAVRFDVEWTLSRTVWWILGPEYGVRWWLLGLPLFALTSWAGPHFLWPHLFGGTQLLVALVVSLVVAGIGIAATR